MQQVHSKVQKWSHNVSHVIMTSGMRLGAEMKRHNVSHLMEIFHVTSPKRAYPRLEDN